MIVFSNKISRIYKLFLLLLVKKLSFCPTLWFSYPYIQTINHFRSNYDSLKYQRFTPSGCKDVALLKSEFVAKTQFLYEEKMPMLKQQLKVKIEGGRETPWKRSIHMFLCPLYLDLSLMDPLLVCRLTSWKTNLTCSVCLKKELFIYLCS